MPSRQLQRHRRSTSTVISSRAATRRIKNWAAWVANAKFREDDVARRRGELGRTARITTRAGKADRLARSYVARMALLRVMHENDIDAFVHAENTVPTPKIQGPNVGTISLDGITPFFQIPRIAVPAGVTDVIYEPAVRAERGQDRLRLGAAAGRAEDASCRTRCRSRITFFAGQGEEPTLIKVGTAYETATHHRLAPPMFGPVKPSQSR